MLVWKEWVVQRGEIEKVGNMKLFIYSKNLRFYIVHLFDQKHTPIMKKQS